MIGVTPDRGFGPATKAATQEVQRFLGIDDDGAAGPGTNTALRKHFRL
jgi:peptidoglycan hydrolase-like protein with peptidoglycan-binding domain